MNGCDIAGPNCECAPISFSACAAAEMPSPSVNWWRCCFVMSHRSLDRFEGTLEKSSSRTLKKFLCFYC